MCDYAFLIYTCIHTYVYIHICTWNKYVKSKAWFRTETNMYWLKKALYWNWLFLRRPVVLPVKQLELAVVKNRFTCLSPISSHKKESSWTFIQVPNIWEIPLSCYSPSESAAVPFKAEELQLMISKTRNFGARPDCIWFARALHPSQCLYMKMMMVVIK